MATNASKPARHKWVKLRLHVYICKVCGMGRVNHEDSGDWRTTYHHPDAAGTSRVQSHVPPCIVGPRTLKYLSKYAQEIAEWKGYRHAIGKPDNAAKEGGPF